MRKKYSWSRIQVLINDTDNYVNNYIFQFPQEPNKYMMFWTMFWLYLQGYCEKLTKDQFRDECIKDRKWNLKEDEWVPDYWRFIDYFYSLPTPPEIWSEGSVFERYLEYDGWEDWYFWGYLDKIDQKQNTVYEFKTGKEWDEKKVQKHRQLLIYAMIYYQNYGKLPKVKLIWWPTQVDILWVWEPVVFDYKYDQSDIDSLIKLMPNVVEFERKLEKAIADWTYVKWFWPWFTI